MGKIFCIMGKSASGKDTIYKNLLEREELGLKRIVLYTTRPQRAGEKDGEEYFFVDRDRYEQLCREGKVIEARSYDTVYGVWTYFTAADAQIDLEHGNYLVIGTLESYEKMKYYFGENRVESVYVELEDGVRLQRALDRERGQDRPKYAEMCRRFLADTEDFSEEKLEAAGIGKRFYNEEIAKCTEEIRAYIEGAADREEWK